VPATSAALLLDRTAVEAAFAAKHLAHPDSTAALAVYKRALATGRGTRFPFWS
jgi:hypothetical protein